MTLSMSLFQSLPARFFSVANSFGPCNLTCGSSISKLSSSNTSIQQFLSTTCVSRSAASTGAQLSAITAIVGSTFLRIDISSSPFSRGQSSASLLSKNTDKPQQDEHTQWHTEKPQDKTLSHGAHAFLPFLTSDSLQ